MSILFFGSIVLYLNAETASIREFIASQMNMTDATVDDAVQSFKEMMLPLIFIIFVPWLINLLGIIYMNKYIVPSGIMLIISGLMMLYTIIIPLILITSGSILLYHHRYYLKHEKYQTPTK